MMNVISGTIRKIYILRGMIHPCSFFRKSQLGIAMEMANNPAVSTINR
jgi:hypothetical protein